MQEDHDDKDYAEEASGDKEEGSREDFNSGPAEEFIGWFCHKFNVHTWPSHIPYFVHIFICLKNYDNLYRSP